MSFLNQVENMKIKFLKAGDTMREIDNNLNNVKVPEIQKPAVEEPVVQAEAPETDVETKEIKDLKNMPEAALGKSQISTDTIDKDMQFLMKYPQEVETLNAMFDKFQEEHSYEEAAQLLEAYKKEFTVK